jgi:hypothetical protein
MRSPECRSPAAYALTQAQLIEVGEESFDHLVGEDPASTGTWRQSRIHLAEHHAHTLGAATDSLRQIHGSQRAAGHGGLVRSPKEVLPGAQLGC